MASRWLISVDELANCYRNDGVVTIDCRFSLADTEYGERSYRQAHIPGAHYLHLDRDLSGPRGEHGGRHPLPAPEWLAERLRGIGIDDDTLVVAYDDQRFAFASRLWWLLRYLGHDRVQVLNGGFAGWCAAGLVVNTEIPVVRTGNLSARVRPGLVAQRQDVLALAQRPEAVLIDSREAVRYRGEQEPIDPIAGHIDGALNFPWQDASDTAGLFQPADRQRQRLQSVIDHSPIVVYCGSGVTACVNLLALAEIGCDDAKLYAGSWSDWCSYLSH